MCMFRGRVSLQFTLKCMNVTMVWQADHRDVPRDVHIPLLRALTPSPYMVKRT